MKKLISLMFAVVVIFHLFTFTSLADDIPTVASSTAILMDAQTGQVLYNKNMDEKMYPASITKIMTAILAVENLRLTDTITLSENAVYSFDDNDIASMGFIAGENISVKDALYAMMLMSANDAANALAEQVSGSIDKFVERMNEKAKEIGATNTHFSNPNGLHEDTHYTTAHDMALITQYAMKNADFCHFFSELTYEIQPTNKQPEARPCASQHDMLKNTQFFYQYATGGKLGWTKQAQYTLVTTAEKDGRELICVVMNSTQPNDKYNDTISLFDYGFSQFISKEISADNLKQPVVVMYDGDTPVKNITFSVSGSLTYLISSENANNQEVTLRYNLPEKINLGENFSASVSIMQGDTEIARYPMDYTAEAIVGTPAELNQNNISTNKTPGFLIFLKYLFIIVLCLVVIFFVILVALRIYYRHIYPKTRRGKMRNRRRRRV